MPDIIKLIVRGFKGRERQWETVHEIDINGAGLDNIIPTLAIEHASAMCEGLLTMIEMEFPDEPDVNQRFFRLGVSPEGMVCPIQIDLTQ